MCLLTCCLICCFYSAKCHSLLHIGKCLFTVLCQVAILNNTCNRLCLSLFNNFILRNIDYNIFYIVTRICGFSLNRFFIRSKSINLRAVYLIKFTGCPVIPLCYLARLGIHLSGTFEFNLLCLSRCYILRYGFSVIVVVLNSLGCSRLLNIVHNMRCILTCCRETILISHLNSHACSVSHKIRLRFKCNLSCIRIKSINTLSRYSLLKRIVCIGIL